METFALTLFIIGLSLIASFVWLVTRPEDNTGNFISLS